MMTIFDSLFLLSSFFLSREILMRPFTPWTSIIFTVFTTVHIPNILNKWFSFLLQTIQEAPVTQATQVTQAIQATQPNNTKSASQAILRIKIDRAFRPNKAKVSQQSRFSANAGVYIFNQALEWAEKNGFKPNEIETLERIHNQAIYQKARQKFNPN